MVYKVIGVMSGSSLDGLDIAYVHLLETGGRWSFEIVEAETQAYSATWKSQLRNAVSLNAMQYQLLHSSYGEYIGQQINYFIEKYQLSRKIDLVASHGHTAFHFPEHRMTAQLGEGAAIAAQLKLPVVSDLRAMDIALGGQGAPIVPIGERLLLKEYDSFLNLGGIANIALHKNNTSTAFDICAANRVLNMLASEREKEFDEGGKIAASGTINETLLQQLNAIDYYGKPAPKSLDNSLGTNTIYPLIKNTGVSVEDALRTYTEHICIQINKVLDTQYSKLLVTGGGAYNEFLIERLKTITADKGIEIIVPDDKLVQYKEALIMALIGTLRWREEPNVLSSVTGATQNSIGGALWLGAEN